MEQDIIACLTQFGCFGIKHHQAEHSGYNYFAFHCGNERTVKKICKILAECNAEYTVISNAWLTARYDAEHDDIEYVWCGGYGSLPFLFEALKKGTT